jgi:DMSO/TMAO reductase YedYZ molybdopterin-dependent catalytic subunit
VPLGEDPVPLRDGAAPTGPPTGPPTGTDGADGGGRAGPVAVLSRPTAALLGIAAVALAVGAGHLVAALVAPAASPPLAVGAAAVRLAPLPLVEFATSTFGTADKTVLLTGVAVVLIAVAALAGLAARRRPGPAVAVVVALGLVAGAAARTAPAFSQLDLLPPLVSTVTGVWAVRWLHRRGLRDTAARDLAGNAGTSPRQQSLPGGQETCEDELPAPPVRRRTVLGSAGAFGVVGAAALATGGAGLLLTRGVGGARAEVTHRLAAARVAPAPPVPPGADLAAFGASPIVTPNADFYRIDTALRVPALETADWTIRVHGMVDRELTLSFAELLARPLVEQTVTLTCVSNEVGGNLVSTARFVGVALRDLLRDAGVRDGADQLLSTSVDGWTAGTPTAVVLEPDRGALLAVGMNGEALPREHGFPVRMVVPGLYGYVSATKWLVDLELTTFAAHESYWVQRGWARRAPVKTQSRIDSPGQSAEVPAGRLSVAGTAWAQHVGVDRVEVRADDGPWQDAQLGTEVNRDTWRMWHTALDLTPGRHVLQCRATDRSGATQTEQRADPVPDGATGWHSVVVNVS